MASKCNRCGKDCNSGMTIKIEQGPEKTIFAFELCKDCAKIVMPELEKLAEDFGLHKEEDE